MLADSEELLHLEFLVLVLLELLVLAMLTMLAVVSVAVTSSNNNCRLTGDGVALWVHTWLHHHLLGWHARLHHHLLRGHAWLHHSWLHHTWLLHHGLTRWHLTIALWRLSVTLRLHSSN